MPSRLNRYYETENNSRTEKNSHLYSDIYSGNNYDNLVGVRSLDKTNEINLEKVRQMIKDRETYQKQKEYLKIAKKETTYDIPTINNRDLEEEAKYDINDFLQKAKENKREDAESMFLKSKKYDYLLDSRIYNNKKGIEEKLEEHEEKINTILNTITKGLDLNKMSTSDLSLDLLSDLKSNTMVGKEMNHLNNISGTKQKAEDIDMDKSFYTSSINISDNDFEVASQIIEKPKKEKIGLKILITAVLLIITILVIYLIFINISGL